MTGNVIRAALALASALLLAAVSAAPAAAQTTTAPPARNQSISPSAGVPREQAPRQQAPAAARQVEQRFPNVLTVASVGTGCVRASLRNTKAPSADPSRGEGDWVLTNSCPMAQIAVVDVGRPLGYTSWPGAENAGSWASTATADAPAGLPFTPIMAETETPKYIVPAFGEYVHHDTQIRLVGPGDPSLGVYIAACDVISDDGFEQVIFRASPWLVTSDQVACGPSWLRSQRPEAVEIAYRQGNTQGDENLRQTEEELARYRADIERYQTDVAQYERDVAAQQDEVANYNAAQAEYRRKQAEYEAELERVRKAVQEYEAAVAAGANPAQ